jgi:hypothetical protein
MIQIFSKDYLKSCQNESKFVVDLTYQNSMLIFFSTRNQCQGDDFPTELAHCFIIVFALHLMTIHIDYASMQSTENQSYLNCEVELKRWWKDMIFLIMILICNILHHLSDCWTILLRPLESPIEVKFWT